MSEDLESDNDLEENYYTFLNLPKDASIDQINASYRKLSRVYHPDKHVNSDKKQKAELLFNRTKKAYEVLSDPHKRAIYDSIGVKGLNIDGWEIVQRTKTPAEILAEYENLARQSEERKLQQLTNPRGNISININATEIFSPYDDAELPKIEVSSMSISQSIDTPITLKDTITMSGNLYSSNGNGGGGFVVCGRRLINKGWLELDLGAGNGPVIGVKGGRTLSSAVTLNGGCSLNFRESGIVPAFVTALAVQLDKHTIGSLTLNASSQSALTTQIDSNSERNSWSTSVVIGSPHVYFGVSYTRKMIEHDLKLKVATKIGTFGFLAEYGAEKKVSRYSSLCASVMIGVPTGVILKLKITRSSQSYVFPIHLSEDIMPAAIFYGTVTPVCAWFLLKKLVIDPMNEERRNNEIRKSKKNSEHRIAIKKKEAQAAVELMQYTYERIVATENSVDGLIILCALYGALKEGTTNFKDQLFIDVTIPLQCQVKDSKLVLYAGSKSELPGFYDACVGEAKTLKIEYRLKNVTSVVIVNDADPVVLPP